MTTGWFKDPISLASIGYVACAVGVPPLGVLCAVLGLHPSIVGLNRMESQETAVAGALALAGIGCTKTYFETMSREGLVFPDCVLAASDDSWRGLRL
jgi:hypothetical protein